MTPDDDDLTTDELLSFWEEGKPVELVAVDGLYRVGGSSFEAGLVVEGGFVVRAAPILRRWALGRAIDEILDEATARRVRIERVGV